MRSCWMHQTRNKTSSINGEPFALIRRSTHYRRGSFFSHLSTMCKQKRNNFLKRSNHNKHCMLVQKKKRPYKTNSSPSLDTSAQFQKKGKPKPSPFFLFHSLPQTKHLAVLKEKPKGNQKSLSFLWLVSSPLKRKRSLFFMTNLPFKTKLSFLPGPPPMYP